MTSCPPTLSVVIPLYGSAGSIERLVRDVAALPDPVGRIVEESTRPNGLVLRKVRVPLVMLPVAGSVAVPLTVAEPETLSLVVDPTTSKPTLNGRPLGRAIERAAPSDESRSCCPTVRPGRSRCTS